MAREAAVAKLVPIVASIRGAVEAAMRNTARPVTAIAAETGVRVTTIRTWNKRFGWRPTPETASTAPPRAGSRRGGRRWE